MWHYIGLENFNEKIDNVISDWFVSYYGFSSSEPDSVCFLIDDKSSNIIKCRNIESLDRGKIKLLELDWQWENTNNEISYHNKLFVFNNLLLDLDGNLDYDFSDVTGRLSGDPNDKIWKKFHKVYYYHYYIFKGLDIAFCYLSNVQELHFWCKGIEYMVRMPMFNGILGIDSNRYGVIFGTDDCQVRMTKGGKIDIKNCYTGNRYYKHGFKYFDNIESEEYGILKFVEACELDIFCKRMKRLLLLI